MTKKVRYKAHFQFYHGYEGEKCGYNTFLDRTIRQHTPMEEAIKPQQHIQKKKSPIKQFWEDYEGPKAKLTTFMRRVYTAGLSFEEAIQPRRRPDSGKRGVAKVQHIPRRKIQEKGSQISVIDITLQPEEASVFRKAYARMLSELESDLEFCEIPSDVPIITAKIKRLKEEIRVFNLYN